MNSCKGLHRIICTNKSGCLRGLKKDVQPDCMDCLAAITQVVDLDGKVVFEYQHDLPPVKTCNPIKPEKTKGKKAIS